MKTPKGTQKGRNEEEREGAKKRGKVQPWLRTKQEGLTWEMDNSMYPPTRYSHLTSRNDRQSRDSVGNETNAVDW